MMISCSHWGLFPEIRADTTAPMWPLFGVRAAYDAGYLHQNAAQAPGWQSAYLNQQSAATNAQFQNYINPGKRD